MPTLPRRLAAVLLGAVGLLALAGCGSTDAYASPDGRFSVEVTESSHPPDRLWTVTVQVGVTASVRSWTVGCLGDDGVEGVPAGVVWTDPTTFRLTTDTGNEVTVRLDASGEPVAVDQPVEALRDCPDR